MSSFSSFACRLGLLVLLARTAVADCESFGVDFHGGKSYFQNSLSGDPFTFVSQYEGCDADVATNVLVDPNGDQYLCSDTPLQPADTDQLSTCPLNKNQLWSGPWSVLILSNNGNAEPIAYERDFELSVGPQETSTFTPTVTATVVTTPIINSTTTTTDTSTLTLPPKTVTTASITITPTTTVTPSRVTVTKTRTLYTFTLTKYTLSVVKATKTVTASCLAATRASKADPTCTIIPTVATAAALASSTPAKLFRRTDNKVVAFDMAKYLKERKERLAARSLEERAPDAQPLVVTDTDTAHWTTETSTSTAPATTVSITTGVSTTSTLTPAPITVAGGKTVLPVVTVTAPTPTKTSTKYTYAYSWTTKTRTTTFTIKSTTTPASVKTACRKHGGILW